MKLQLPVWPWYGCALFTLILGIALVVMNRSSEVPDKQDLVVLSGELARLEVRDDLAGESVGVQTGTEAVYITLKGLPQELRYPLGYPQYLRVRQRFGVSLEAWVDGARVGGDEALTIFQFKEHNPFKQAADYIGKEIFVSYEEIRAASDRVGQSYRQLGWWLLLAGAVCVLIARLIGRWNMRPNRAG